jgi:hypothetical protein
VRSYLDCSVGDVIFPQRTRHQIRVRCMVSRPASARYRLGIFNPCAAKGCHDFGIRLHGFVEKLAVFRSRICYRFSVTNLLPFFGWESSILSCCRKAVRVSCPKNGSESCPTTSPLEPNMAASLPRGINNATSRFARV